jgi:hypothetical protein
MRPLAHPLPPAANRFFVRLGSRCELQPQRPAPCSRCVASSNLNIFVGVNLLICTRAGLESRPSNATIGSGVSACMFHDLWRVVHILLTLTTALSSSDPAHVWLLLRHSRRSAALPFVRLHLENESRKFFQIGRGDGGRWCDRCDALDDGFKSCCVIVYGIIHFESCSFLQVLKMPRGYVYNVALQLQHQLVRYFTSFRPPLTQRCQCELPAQRGVLLAKAGGGVLLAKAGGMLLAKAGGMLLAKAGGMRPLKWQDLHCLE